MADLDCSSSSSSSSFHGFDHADIGNFGNPADVLGLADSGQSDISVSSVHTADLSDFSSGISDIPLSSSDDDIDSDAEWTDTIDDWTEEEFSGGVGPRVPLPLNAAPIDYFQQLFPDRLFADIRDETIRYARQRGDATFDTSVAELKAYMGILFLMGVIGLPNYRCYWSSRKELRQPVIADVMSRNRYEMLTKYFHLNDNTTQRPRGSPEHDKLHKVRPMIDHAKRVFCQHYAPHQNIAVDEAMIKFKGRCSFLQYIPSKPCKWGIKAWALADSESFYLVNFDVYVGKDGADGNARNNIPLGTKVVTKLVEPYYKKRHHVYFDNYFTSVKLVESLARKKTYATGTVRKERRGLPVPMKSLKMKQSGEMRKWQKGRMMAVSWQEKKRQVSVLFFLLVLFFLFLS